MKLTVTQDIEDLKNLEAIINKNLTSAYEAGRALTEINERELYKLKNNGKYTTFKEYCKDTWDISRSRAYQLIDAAQVQENLSTIVDKEIPESQARALVKLEPEQQREVWQKAAETAQDNITAGLLSKTIKNLYGTPYKEKKKPESEPQPKLAGAESAISVAEYVISLLENIATDDPTAEKAFSMIAHCLDKQQEKTKISREQARELPNYDLPFEQTAVG
jgi:hypothetical protein